MGQSTDAILAYGFDLNAVIGEYGEIGWEEFLPEAVRAEIEKMDGFYDLEKSIPDWLKTHNVTSVGIVRHCSCDYTMHILGREVVRAWRGQVVTLNWPVLYQQAIDERWREQAIEAARLLGIEVGEAQPQWFLVSMWC